MSPAMPAPKSALENEPNILVFVSLWKELVNERERESVINSIHTYVYICMFMHIYGLHIYIHTITSIFIYMCICLHFIYVHMLCKRQILIQIYKLHVILGERKKEYKWNIKLKEKGKKKGGAIGVQPLFLGPGQDPAVTALHFAPRVAGKNQRLHG